MMSNERCRVMPQITGNVIVCSTFPTVSKMECIKALKCCESFANVTSSNSTLQVIFDQCKVYDWISNIYNIARTPGSNSWEPNNSFNGHSYSAIEITHWCVYLWNVYWNQPTGNRFTKSIHAYNSNLLRLCVSLACKKWPNQIMIMHMSLQ